MNLIDKVKKPVAIGSTLVLLSLPFGCATKRGTGAAVGAGVGGTIGALATKSHTWWGLLIGTAVGGLAGYFIGNEEDKREAERWKTQAEQQGYIIEEIENSNGSVTMVRLKQLSDRTFQGPRGEIYKTYPSDEQLLQVYGVR